MKKTFFFIMGIALPVISLLAQSSATIRPLTIGDTVPDIAFNNIINYKTTSARLSDFKGKLVILDFWATWCKPCIKELPKLDSLQSKFQQELIILPISREKEEIVAEFLRKRKDLKLPSVTGENDGLYGLFPHKSIPHAIIIDPSGQLKATTGTGNISEYIISELLKNKKVDLPVKKDLMNFNPMHPLLLNNNGGGYEDVLYRSLITRRLKGISSQTGLLFDKVVSREASTGFYFRNITIPQLFLNAFRKPTWYMYSRTVYKNITDKNKYLPDHFRELTGFDEEKFRNKSLFCYELIAPAMDENTRYQIMQRDLSTYFMELYGVTAGIEKKRIKCYKLVRHTAKNNPANQNITNNDSIKIDVFRGMLEADLSIPVINQSGYSPAMYIKIPKSKTTPNYKDLSTIKTVLRENGLDIIRGSSKIEVLVLEEHPNL